MFAERYGKLVAASGANLRLLLDQVDSATIKCSLVLHQ